MKKNLNSFGTRSELKVGSPGSTKTYAYHSLTKLDQHFGGKVAKLPFSIRVLLENLLRFEDGVIVRKQDIEAIVNWNPTAKPDKEIQFMPARILLQDFTGVPAVADMAAMRGAVKRMGGDPGKINPLQPADLVIDHSVQVDHYASPDAFEKNAALEFQRNGERYEFLRWGQSALKNFRVVPPDTGIVHQVNLEYLSYVAMDSTQDGTTWVYPDSLIGTDSHTTMINGLGVVGWGVGGIEAEAAMLGQPVSMLIPNVVGFKLTGKAPPETTATDIVLRATEMLRKKGVVEKFVEFYGPGLASLSLADRATIANMAPEYGATIGIFPVDEKTTEYLKLTGRTDRAAVVEAYFKAQGMWYDPSQAACSYSDGLELDLGTIDPCLAGPSRPQDRVPLKDAAAGFEKALPTLMKKGETNLKAGAQVKSPRGETYELQHGSVVIGAITSCTNTSNPTGLITAGLLARNAVAKGLKRKDWVKTSLAPGSKVVTEYYIKAGLMKSMEALGFHLVGYGCTTCIGNSGPLDDHITDGILKNNLVVSAVLSGNRNFEGRISPHIRANYLASPALVVAYSIAGDIKINLTKDPLGKGSDGKPVYLKDIWPTTEEITKMVNEHVTAHLYSKVYSDVFTGEKAWQNIQFPKGDLYQWDAKSTYIKEPPFFATLTKTPNPVTDIQGARVLALLGDSVTTDHISPAGNIQKTGPAGTYLIAQGVKPEDFNSYGARRGNHEVMVR
ncbi:MAG: aconitate hydratase AcnA, partial [Bacteriovoracia bacterium]